MLLKQQTQEEEETSTDPMVLYIQCKVSEPFFLYFTVYAKLKVGCYDVCVDADYFYIVIKCLLMQLLVIDYWWTETKYLFSKTCLNLNRRVFLFHLLLEKGGRISLQFRTVYTSSKGINASGEQRNLPAVFSYQHLSSVGMKS